MISDDALLTPRRPRRRRLVFDRETLQALLVEEPVEIIVDVALTLAQGPSAPWAALQGLEVPARRRSSPLFAALARLADPETWPFVRSAEHYDALRLASTRRLGFGDVALEEALVLPVSEDPVLPNLEPVQEALAFVRLLHRTYPGDLRTPDLLLRAWSALASVHLARREPVFAAEALDAAEPYLATGDGHFPAGRARYLQVSAALADQRGHQEEAVLHYEESLRLLAAGHPRHHLEVAVGLAALHARQGRTRDAVEVVTKASELLKPWRHGRPDTLRRHTLYHSARWLILALAGGLGRDEVPPVVLEMIGELEAHRWLFEAAGELALALHHLLLGELYLLHDGDQAAHHLRKAQLGLTLVGETRLASEAELYLEALTADEPLPEILR